MQDGHASGHRRRQWRSSLSTRKSRLTSRSPTSDAGDGRDRTCAAVARDDPELPILLMTGYADSAGAPPATIH
jgi:hypothetical protein